MRKKLRIEELAARERGVDYITYKGNEFLKLIYQQHDAGPQTADGQQEFKEVCGILVSVHNHYQMDPGSEVKLLSGIAADYQLLRGDAEALG